jgi:hypothetical protein
MIDDSEEAQWASQILHERIHMSDLRRHPDCRDPDHPGCEECEGEQEIDD